MHIPFVFNENSITFQFNHKLYMIDASNPSYEAAKAELRKGAAADGDLLVALSAPATAIQAQVEAAEAADYLPRGTVSVTKNEILFNGVPVNGVLVERILASMAEGFNIMPQIRFLENLWQNPNEWSRDELYLWLEDNNLPITEDGHFLAYKTVKANFKSHHDGVTDNTPGTVVSVPRETVDTVRAHTCSTGLHFCSKSYLKDGPMAAGTVVVLKINPADVVSIPDDYNNAKGRAWKYLVLAVLDESPESKQWATIVSADGGTFAPPTGAPVSTEAPATEPDDGDLLVIGSDLAKKLFALCNEIGLTERDDRLDWAYDVLDELDMAGDFTDSFNELTYGQAEVLVEAAQAKADELSAQADATIASAQDAVSAARQRQIDVINGLGIIALRQRAAKAGHAGAWKGPKSADLKAYLIGQIK